MSVEELLQELQSKGLDDDAIKTLLKDTIATLDKDFSKADEKGSEDEMKAASDLLGVNL